MICGCAVHATGMLETYFSDKLNEFSARLEDGGEVVNFCQSHPYTYAASMLHYGQGVMHLLIPCSFLAQSDSNKEFWPGTWKALIAHIVSLIWAWAQA